jgi:predicted transcriptional regulator YdeE
MELKTKDEFKLVGLKKVTTLNNCQKDLPLLWQEFNRRHKEVKGVANPAFLGVGFMEKETNPNDCYNEPYAYVAGFEVRSSSKAPKGMVSKVIPKLRYAVFQHRGNLKSLWNTYEDIYSKQLPINNLKPHAQGYGIESYPEGWTDEENAVMEIWIALE